MSRELDKMKITEKWDSTDGATDAKWAPCLERDICRELWINRPWKYLPRLWRGLRHYPRSRAVSRLSWLRYCVQVSWRVIYKDGGRGRYASCAKCLCRDCTNAVCYRNHCVFCGGCATFVCGRRGLVKDEEASV